MRARSIENGTWRLIVFMEYDLALLVSMAVLDMAGIHIRSRMRARSIETGTRRPLCS